MTSPKVGATVSLVMFLIVCTGCINKDLVEARKIEVIKQSDDEHVYYIDNDGPKAAPPSINNPEDMNESVDHTDYHGPCYNGCIHDKLPNASPPSINTPKDINGSVEIHDKLPKASPPSINTPEDMNGSVDHTDYHGPCYNGCIHDKLPKASPPSINTPEDINGSVDQIHDKLPKASPPSINTPEDMNGSVDHTDYHDPCYNGCIYAPPSINTPQDMDESVYHTDYRGATTYHVGPPKMQP